MSKSDFRVLLVYPNYQMVNLLPTNIGILTAALADAGYSVDLFDTTYYRTSEKSIDEIRVENLQLRKFNLEEFGIRYKPNSYLDDFRAKVESFRPDLIGVTVVEDTWPQAKAMLERISDLRIPNILGGVFPTLSPDDAISFDCVDMVCVGEGEGALLELCDRMSAGLDVSGILNLYVKDRRTGAVSRNPMRPAVNLNDVPFPNFNRFEKERFYRPMQGVVRRMVPVEFSRGCPYQCTFCEAPAILNKYKEQTKDHYYRRKRPQVVADQIRRFQEKYAVEYLYFNDEVFLAMSDEVFDEFAEMYRSIRIPFWMQTRIETMTDHRAEVLKEIGCAHISIGIESGSEEYRRKIIKKTFTNSYVIQQFELFRKHRLPVSVNNIIGFPDETREMIFDTIELNRQIYSDTVNCYYFVPYRGTPLRDLAVERGYVKDDLQTNTPMIAAYLDQPQLRREEVDGLVRTFPLYVKLPKDLWPAIRRAEKKDEEGNRIFKELAEIFYRDFYARPKEMDQDLKYTRRACFVSSPAPAAT